MPGPDFSADMMQQMAESAHTYTPAEAVPRGPGVGTKVTAAQLNQAFVELSGLVDRVPPFIALCHLKRCAEALREAAGAGQDGGHR